MIKAPVVAQSPVVQQLCMAEQGGRSMSHDIELLRRVEGEKLSLHRESRSTPSISAAVLLRKNNNN